MTLLYILADGHHRYEAALSLRQTHFLAYITQNPQILAYDRLINGNKSFKEIINPLKAKGLEVVDADNFQTPDKKGKCCVYTKERIYIVNFNNIPENVIGSLDINLLKRDFFPLLGLDNSNIKDPKHFRYLPETQLEEMKRLVDKGFYSMAIAMHPIAPEEVIAVADANLRMPGKSTYFYPKILTGLFLLKIQYK